MNDNNLKKVESSVSDKKKDEKNLDWKELISLKSNSKIFSIFSYKLNMDKIKEFYENSDFESGYNWIAIPILFNKRNKFVFLLSIFYWVFYKIITYSLIFLFLFFIFYMLKNFTNLGYWSYTSIYYWIIVIFSLFYGFIFFYFDLKKWDFKRKKWRKKRINECAFVNMHMWTLAKYFYKFKKILDEKKNVYFDDWKNLIDAFSELYSLIIEFLLFYGNVFDCKTINISKFKKIKKYKDNKKPINGKISIFAIVIHSYYFKFLNRFFVFMIFSSLVFIPISYI
ncbi:MAG: hypothetical protein K2H56_00300 [Malacoplasma sp.]|nr:hypothetical protein [Malacoplasma sp.]